MKTSFLKQRRIASGIGDGGQTEIRGTYYEKQSSTQLEMTMKFGIYQPVAQEEPAWKCCCQTAVPLTSEEWQRAEEFALLSVSMHGDLGAGTL